MKRFSSMTSKSPSRGLIDDLTRGPRLAPAAYDDIAADSVTAASSRA
jgi:hypothetical protein